jgi:uncharacterized Zn finger protein
MTALKIKCDECGNVENLNHGIIRRMAELEEQTYEEKAYYSCSECQARKGREAMERDFSNWR